MAIAGTTRERETLTADPGTWQGSEPIVFRYQWQVCSTGRGDCEDIHGATAAAHVPQGGTSVQRDLGNEAAAEQIRRGDAERLGDRREGLARWSRAPSSIAET